MNKGLLVLIALWVIVACQNEEGHSISESNIPVSGICLDLSSITIKEGETVVLTPTITPNNASNKKVIWTSSSNAIATVDNDGKVTGIKAGSAAITSTTEDGGKEATCALTVETNLAPSVTVEANHISAISAVLIGKANLGSTVAADLRVGFQYSTSAGILPSNSTSVEATDADSNYNYTTLITELEPDCKYYFRSFVLQNGQYIYGETKEFTTKDLSSLIHTLEATAVSAVGARLNAIYDLTDIQFKTMSFGFYWGTSLELANSKVSAIEGTGTMAADLSSLTPSKQYFYQAFIVLDGREFKEAVMSFTTKDLESLLETKAPTDIDATSAKLNAKLDLSDVKYKSVIYGFYWSTSEASQDTGIKGGAISNNAYSSSLTNLSQKTQYWYKAYVTLDDQTFYGIVRSFMTNVPVGSVSMDIPEYLFKSIGRSIQLTATVLPDDATNKSVYWSSDKEDVAVVDASGKVTAKGNGQATITVTTKDQGKTATCAISVSQIVTSIVLNNTSYSLAEGKELTLVATVNPNNANDKSLIWTSSDDSIASVDENGKVTAVSKGIATIKATANDGSNKNASCIVTVFREAEDLGLSVKWATCNLGAANPEEYGDYYAWGEIEPHYSCQDPITWVDNKIGYSWGTYKWCRGSETTLLKYNTNSSFGVVDNKVYLDPEDDAAHIRLGGSWRMPTDAEWKALRTKCTWTWTIQNEVKGRLVTGPNGNSIFLPCAGDRYERNRYAGYSGKYWSASLNTDNPTRALSVFFNSGGIDQSHDRRFDGMTIRPVCD